MAEALLDPLKLRREFPSLERVVGSRKAIYFDGPGGTQVPVSVTAAITGYLGRSNANIGGVFITSQETGDLLGQARREAALFLGANAADEVVFGQNMTSLTFSISRAIARTWSPGDEVIVSTLDHDANIAPWLMAAEDRGVVVKRLRCQAPEWTLSPEALKPLLSKKTKMVALTAASNAIGTMVELAPLIDLAHQAGALAFVDTVHYAPHMLIDARGLDCDFLACSAYKFCGPHIGMLYGKKAHLEALTAYKVRPSSSVPPGKWETGTQNMEAIAGLRACFAYLGAIGRSPGSGPSPLTRGDFVESMTRIAEHERGLAQHFLGEAANIRGLKVYGVTDPQRASRRTPTFGVTLTCSPRQASQRLAERGIFVWDGHFYATELIEELGLTSKGGLLRIGFAHYNTIEEVDTLLAELKDLA